MAARLRIVAFLAIVLAASLGYYYFRQRTPDGVLRASGTIEATKVDISFQIPGRVVELLAREGDPVKSGAVLARMSADELNARVNQIQASLESISSQAAQQQAAVEMREAVIDNQIKQAQGQADAARVAVERLREGTRPQEIRVAEAALAQAEAEMEKRKNDAQRLATLLAKDIVSKQEYDTVHTAYIASQTAVTTARERLALAREGARKEDVAEAEARLRSATAGVGIAEAGRKEIDMQRRALDAAHARERELRAQLDAAKTQLGYTEIKSPIDGVVLIKSVESGEVVNPGTPVATVGDIQNLWMNIYIPETHTGRIQLGQVVQVRVDSFPNETFIGKITFISSQSEFTPKTIQTEEERVKLVYRVKVSIEGSGQKLKPGMPADAEITLK